MKVRVSRDETDQRLICPQHPVVWLESVPCAVEMSALHQQQKVSLILFHRAAADTQGLRARPRPSRKPCQALGIPTGVLSTAAKVVLATGNSGSGTQTEPQP